MMKNDCYKCKHKKEVPGSAHSKCAYLEDNGLGSGLAIQLSVVVSTGKIVAFGSSESYIKFNLIGVKGGWCAWPLNFDPSWVDCRLKILNDETTGV